jgi:hypothetical protein
MPWNPELEQQLIELTLLDEVTRKTIKFLTAARKAEMSPQELSSTITSRNRWQDSTIKRAQEWATFHNGTLKAHKAHEDGIVYAWDILIPLNSKYKLLIEVDRTEDVEHWTDPLLMQARVYSGPRKKDDRFGRYITQGFTELSRKDHLKALLKSANEYIAPPAPVKKAAKKRG